MGILLKLQKRKLTYFIFRLGYKNKSYIAVRENNRCLFWEHNKTQTQSVGPIALFYV